MILNTGWKIGLLVVGILLCVFGPPPSGKVSGPPSAWTWWVYLLLRRSETTALTSEVRNDLAAREARGAQMKEPLLVITTEDKSTMKLDELLKEVQECIHTPRAASLMLDVAVGQLPRFTRGLRKEKKKFEGAGA